MDPKKIAINPLVKQLGASGADGVIRIAGYVSSVNDRTVELMVSLGGRTTVKIAQTDILDAQATDDPSRPVVLRVASNAKLEVRTDMAASDLSGRTSVAFRAAADDDSGGGPLDDDLECLLDFAGDTIDCLVGYYDNLSDPDVSNATAELEYALCDVRAKRKLNRCKGVGAAPRPAKLQALLDALRVVR